MPTIPLRNLPLPPLATPLPPEVRDFLQEADERIEHFCRAQVIPGFVPSDFPLVYHALHYVASSGLAAGTRFCEWGSGFGIVTCLAALAGFDAYGIEIDSSLVDQARQLAADFGLRAEFLCDSFVPPGGEACLECVETSGWLTLQAGDVENTWGLGPEDFDVTYLYPWPEEEQALTSLFEQHASAGALLLTFHGLEELRLRRKVRGSRRSPGRRTSRR